MNVAVVRENSRETGRSQDFVMPRAIPLNHQITKQYWSEIFKSQKKISTPRTMAMVARAPRGLSPPGSVGDLTVYMCY
jgi:hypothetical protein